MKIVQLINAEPQEVVSGEDGRTVYAANGDPVEFTSEGQEHAKLRWVDFVANVRNGNHPFSEEFAELSDSDPVGDVPLLGGERSYRFDVVEGTYLLLIDGESWRDKIDTDAQAATDMKEQAIAAVKALEKASKSAGIPIILPSGSEILYTQENGESITGDFVDGSGKTVRIHLGEEHQAYWTSIGVAVARGKALPSFFAMEGRVHLSDASHMNVIADVVLDVFSPALTARANTPA